MKAMTTTVAACRIAAEKFARSSVSMLALLILCTVPAHAAPPPGLLGKSVIISWSEDLAVRPLGAGSTRNHTHAVTRTAYISTAGRIFWREQRRTVVERGRPPGWSGSAQAAPGDPNTTGAKKGSTEFRGTQMIHSVQYQSGARRIVVDFAGGFSSCSADVIQGREGVQSQRLRSIVTGEWMDIVSVKARAPECSVREGPAF